MWHVKRAQQLPNLGRLHARVLSAAASANYANSAATQPATATAQGWLSRGHGMARLWLTVQLHVHRACANVRTGVRGEVPVPD